MRKGLLLPQAPASDCSNLYWNVSLPFIKREVGWAPLLVSLVLMSQPSFSSSYKGKPSSYPSPEDSCQVLPAICHPWWAISLTVFALNMNMYAPPSINHWCLWAFFGPSAGHLAGLLACRVRPNSRAALLLSQSSGVLSVLWGIIWGTVSGPVKEKSKTTTV